MEPLQNMGPIHSGCADDRHKECQKSIKNMDLKPENLIGLHVKAAFSLNGETEHMWVEVTGLSEDPDHHIRGTLANEPVIVTEMSLGDIIELKMEEIEQVL